MASHVSQLYRAEALLAAFLLCVSFAATLHYTGGMTNPNRTADRDPQPTVIASRLTGGMDGQGFPLASAWKITEAIHFNHDWRGQNASPGLATEVRVLWSPETLFLRFVAHYQSLHVYPEARNDGWRDELWERDVAETFLQADSRDPLKYQEFEIAPNGFWIDLDISHGGRAELHSALRRRVVVDEPEKTWTAELAIPMKSLTREFDPSRQWRVNFFRVEGKVEPRFYSAWSPTFTPAPNFHVPDSFGRLVFR